MPEQYLIIFTIFAQYLLFLLSPILPNKITGGTLIFICMCQIAMLLAGVSMDGFLGYLYLTILLITGICLIVKSKYAFYSWLTFLIMNLYILSTEHIFLTLVIALLGLAWYGVRRKHFF